MPLDVDKPFCPLEVNGNQLAFLVKHKVFGLDVAVQIAAVMYEL